MPYHAHSSPHKLTPSPSISLPLTDQEISLHYVCVIQKCAQKQLCANAIARLGTTASLSIASNKKGAQSAKSTEFGSGDDLCRRVQEYEKIACLKRAICCTVVSAVWSQFQNRTCTRADHIFCPQVREAKKKHFFFS